MDTHSISHSRNHSISHQESADLLAELLFRLLLGSMSSSSSDHMLKSLAPPWAPYCLRGRCDPTKLGFEKWGFCPSELWMGKISGNFPIIPI